MTGKPPGQEKNYGDFRNFRRLKRSPAKSDPTPRTIDAHPQVGHEAKREGDERQAKPDPPGPRPKMVIDDGCYGADNEANSEPSHLSLHKKIDVTMTVARERARAEKHDDTDDQHAKNCQEQEISTP